MASRCCYQTDSGIQTQAAVLSTKLYAHMPLTPVPKLKQTNKKPKTPVPRVNVQWPSDTLGPESVLEPLTLEVSW